MVHLFEAVRLPVNYLQPSFHLSEKLRSGARVIKRYRPSATPCERVMQDATIPAWKKEEISECRAGLDPVALPRSIREAQSAIATMSSLQPLEFPYLENLVRFLVRLPSMWQEGEARLTHKARARSHLRGGTRKDPFEGAWCDMLRRLERDPGTIAKDLMPRLSDAPSREIQRCPVATPLANIK